MCVMIELALMHADATGVIHCGPSRTREVDPGMCITGRRGAPTRCTGSTAQKIIHPNTHTHKLQGTPKPEPALDFTRALRNGFSFPYCRYESRLYNTYIYTIVLRTIYCRGLECCVFFFLFSRWTLAAFVHSCVRAAHGYILI